MSPFFQTIIVIFNLIFFIKKIKIKLLDQVSSYHHPRNSSGLICKKHQI